MRDGYAFAPDRPGHGLTLSETARRQDACPDVKRAEICRQRRNRAPSASQPDQATGFAQKTPGGTTPWK